MKSVSCVIYFVMKYEQTSGFDGKKDIYAAWSIFL